MAHPIMARLLLLLGVSEAAAAMEGAARVTGNRPTSTMTAVNACGAALPGRPASRAARASTLRVPFSPRCAELDKDDLPTGELDQLSKDLYDEITSREVQNFNEELYRHLEKREEYLDSEIYKGLRQRVDVDEPLTARFEENKNMRLKGPDPALTPSEVIDLVLLAMREKREEGDSTGAELMQRFMGPGSSIHSATNVSPQQLVEYFAESKYAILLEWVSVQYTRKLEVSLDKKRARQQLRLKNPQGTWINVNFQLAKYPGENGLVWLIEQVMVKDDEADAERMAIDGVEEDE